MYLLVQGVITEYVEPRICNVIQIPDHYPITNVRLPYTFMNQTRPLVGSVVMVAQADAFKSYIISVLREPEQSFNSNVSSSFTDDSQFRGAISEDEGGLAEGDVFLQANGIPDTVSGFGAYLHINSAGNIDLVSSSGLESLTIGGEIDSDDHEIIMQAPNIFVESTIDFTGTQSAFEFNDAHTIKVINKLNTFSTSSLLEVPIGELSIDILGNIALRNTTGILDKGALRIDAAGDIFLKNNLGSLNILATGNILANGPTILLNNGTLGVARLTDTVLSNAVTDPAWWLFWSLLPSLITALPVTPLDGGATLKAGLSTLFATIPTLITSKIASASVTVRAGN